VIKHYLTTALRHYQRHKFTTAINVLCLTLGLITFAVAYGISAYNSRGDLYHEKSARTFVLMQKNEVVSSDVTLGFQPYSGLAVGPLLKANTPNLETVARLSKIRELAVATSSSKLFADASFADPEFLDVFDFDFVSGDKRAALRTPRSVVVRDDLAMRIWGRLDVLGETLLLNNKERVQVTGVMRAPREPSHLTGARPGAGVGFEMLVSMDTRNAMWSYEQTIGYNDLMDQGVHTYIVLPRIEPTNFAALKSTLADFGHQHIPTEYGKASFGILPVAEIRKSIIDSGLGTNKTGISSTTSILLMGSLVLLVACLNYANLAVAHTTIRIKELAMRRVVGATRRQIATQSFIEAFILVAFAGLLALALLPLLGAALKTGIGMDIRPVLFHSFTFAWVWLAVIVATAILACAYPAFVIARVRPAQALQNARGARTRRLAFRTLVVCQIIAASYLLIASKLMQTQNDALWHQAENLQTDPIVIIGNNLLDINVSAEDLKAQLRQQPAIKSVSSVSRAPGVPDGNYRLVMSGVEPGSKHWLAFAPSVDDEFFSTMDISLLAGRGFSKQNASDATTGFGSGSVVVDRALAAQYGWTNPQDAIGKQIFLPQSAAANASAAPVGIIGVTENKTLYPTTLLGASSTFYIYNTDWATTVVVRLPKNQLEQGLKAIDATWNQLAPGVALKRRFVDEQFEATYQRFSSVSAAFSFVGLFATLIAVFGLLGIATHSIAQRTFEIGVRRTLGASVNRVLLMLLRDFSKPVIIANLIAWPMAFASGFMYRINFTDHAPISIAPFLLSVAIGIGIAWLAVLRQSIQAARMNPAAVLRHE
jgi:putative ABC transport system permease protein